MTAAANATPNSTGTISHSNAAATPSWKRNPRMTPVIRMTSVVPKRRTTSALSRASRPAARWTGSTHSRARNPSMRSALIPTMPAVDPDIAASKATSGTLRYRLFSPVAAVIESPRTTSRVSRNPTGSSSACTIVMGLRTNRTSRRLESTPVCDNRWAGEFSECAWASTALGAPASTVIRISAGRPRRPTAGSQR